MTAIADMTAEAVSPERIDRIPDYPDDWNNTDFDERRLVVDGMISTVKAVGDNMKIEWKIRPAITRFLSYRQ